jgi:hypothetical protein
MQDTQIHDWQNSTIVLEKRYKQIYKEEKNRKQKEIKTGKKMSQIILEY